MIGASYPIAGTWYPLDEDTYEDDGGSASSSMIGSILGDNDRMHHAHMRRCQTQAIPYGPHCAYPQPQISDIEGVDMGVWFLPPTYQVLEAEWVLMAFIELACTIYACPYTVDGPQDTGWLLGDGGVDSLALVGAASPWGAGLPISTSYVIPARGNPNTGMYGLALYSTINPLPGTFGGTQYGMVHDVLDCKILSARADMGTIDGAGEFWAIRLTLGVGVLSSPLSGWFQVVDVLGESTAVLRKSPASQALAPSIFGTIRGWEARRVSSAVIHSIMLREKPLTVIP